MNLGAIAGIARKEVLLTWVAKNRSVSLKLSLAISAFLRGELAVELSQQRED